MIVIPAPPGSQVASYDTDEDGGRQMVWRSICAVILSDHLANAGQLTEAVTTAGPMDGWGWMMDGGVVVGGWHATDHRVPQAKSSFRYCLPASPRVGLPVAVTGREV